MMNKDYLRKKYKNIKEDASIYLDAYSIIKNYKNIGFYYPLKGELENSSLLDLIKNKNVYYPYIKNNTFEFHKMDGYKIKDDMGIYSYNGEKIDVNILDIILIPGLAFNKNGYRLGHGNGFYDRVLEKYQGIKIGVCFSKCVIDEEFEEVHDIKVDYIVTEKEIIKL